MTSFLDDVFNELISDKKLAQKIFELATAEQKKKALQQCRHRLSKRYQLIKYNYEQLVANAILREELKNLPEPISDFLLQLPHNLRSTVVETTKALLADRDADPLDWVFKQCLLLSENFQKIERFQKREDLLPQFISLLIRYVYFSTKLK